VCIIVNATVAVIGCGGSVRRATANQRVAYNDVSTGGAAARRCKRWRLHFDVGVHTEQTYLRSSCEEAVTSIRSG